MINGFKVVGVLVVLDIAALLIITIDSTGGSLTTGIVTVAVLLLLPSLSVST